MSFTKNSTHQNKYIFLNYEYKAHVKKKYANCRLLKAHEPVIHTDDQNRIQNHEILHEKSIYRKLNTCMI